MYSLGDHKGNPGTISASSVWQMHLLGGLRLQRGQETITRFRSQKFGALLAYLALFPNRLHAREELAELLWPDAEPEVARVNLRTALSSLRRQLEPPGDPAGSFFVVDGRTYLRLNREAVRTDVADFEDAIAAAARTTGEVSARHLAAATDLYTGPLFPGCYETWALSERERLAETHLRALQQLADLRGQAGDADQALDYARRAVSVDPLREDSHATVIRLLMKSGQETAAKRQFDELARLLKEQYDCEPEPQVKALLSLAPTPPVSPSSAGGIAAITPSVISPRVVEAESVPQNFPLTLTRFFGREAEIEALRRRLQEDTTRLITITGPGGCGKTRVAGEAARALGHDFRGGVWFVPLVDTRTAERFPESLVIALGIPRSAADTPTLAQVAKLLQSATASESSRVLLVLDNFEQLAESASGMVAELLAQVPGLSFLTTSRQRLRIEGETEFPLQPLPVPEYSGTPERLLEFSSVQLFVNRAQAARADFQLNSRNADAVASLCARLEGIPLAIELAAAWMGVLSPAQMLSRMSKRLDMLVSRRRDVSPRHRTLRAAIESSVALLPEEIRPFFAALSVFRGGWTLEAAEAVCAAGGEMFALEYLTELCDHSLIVRASSPSRDASEEGAESVLRFRMLETLREFSSEMLPQLGGTAMSHAENRHIAFFTRMIEEGIPHLTGPDQSEWLRRFQADHANIRAMLDCLDQRQETTEALRLGGLLTGFWQVRGHISEGRRLLDYLLKRAGETAPALLQAQALSGAGKLAYFQGDYAAARAHQDTCLTMYRAEGDAAGIARTLCELGNCEMLKSNYADAFAFCEESLAGYRALGDKKGIALLLNNLGAICLAKGLPRSALPYLEESLPLSREIGHHRIVALALLNLASIWQNEGECERARSCYEQCLAVRRELGDAVGIGRVLEGLARVAMESGDADTALNRFEESLAVRRRHDDRDGMASALLYRGLTQIKLRQDFAGGGSSLQECLKVCEQTGNRHFASYALEGLATIAAARQHRDRAVRLWSAAQALRETLGVTSRPKDAQALTKEIGIIRAEMGDTAFDRAWKKGLSLSREEASLLGIEDLPRHC